MNNF
jgi:hypothetical protein